MHTRIIPRKIALKSRIEALRSRHGKLESRIEVEHRRPLPDTSVLQRLKREKLRLKDEISRYDGLARTLARGRAATG